ncbi:unnamed protein product [Peniophora sp. CBMAI 1063]|nr:unnamed protein product [Peniophora sp. CBMAI 1063]
MAPSPMSPASPAFAAPNGNGTPAGYSRRRSLSDPFTAMLRPPADETPAERHQRLEAEHRARQVSESIDQQLKLEHQEQKKNKVDVKVLLLGQSESGKSTTLKQFQLAHTPAAFRAERMAWRPVIYLNLVRSIRRILDAISPDLDEPVIVPQTALTDTSFAQPSAGVVLSDTEIAQKHARYSERLAPLLDLEERLITMLAEDDEEEATRLGDGSSPGWSHGSYTGRPSLSVETRIPAAQGARSPGSSSLHRSHGEVAVRTTSNWKKALSLSRVKLRPAAPDQPGGEVVGWWEDPSDPVHVLSQCSRDMTALWADPWVRTRLAARRIRLEESSGFYLNEIDRITAKKYIPTDDDVLKARLKTMGVVEHTFTVSTGPKVPKPMVWKIFDVGGARNQRQAWAPYFTDANAIIFLAPISAFDQVLAEDPRVNRLEDSLLLWRSVVSNKLLQHVNLIIFLNKCDLLKAKLESGVRLNQYLLTYGERPNDYDSVSRYLRNKFGLLHQQYTPNPNRELFIHFTAVTDTRRTSTIIANVRDIIVRQNLKDSKLLV